jgi:hypothetical protein
MSREVLGSKEIKSKKAEKSNKMKLYFGKNESRQESQHP